MSLINEALKRTRDASFQSSQPRATTADSYRISTDYSHSGTGSHTGLWATVLVVAVAGVGILVFALRVMKPGEQVKNALNVSEMIQAPVASDTTAARPAVAPYQAPSVVGRVPTRGEMPVSVAPVVGRVPPRGEPVTTAASGDAAYNDAPEPVAPPAPVVPESPKFVLQGITSAATWREAMINGYTVREGEEVQGARVVTIETRQVKLQFGDHEILLRMH